MIYDLSIRFLGLGAGLLPLNAGIKRNKMKGGGVFGSGSQKNDQERKNDAESKKQSSGGCFINATHGCF